MQTAENQYTYFQNLEQLTKSGFVAYLILMLAGSVIAICGVDTTFHFFSNIKICQSLLIALITVNLLQITIRAINKIDWLGKVHIWLDKKLFRFLFRSNEIILRELLVLLEPNERALVDELGRAEKTAMAQSIFSHLAEDQSIFERLLKRGVFRSWIWYWITIYGVFVFFLLAIISFSRSLLAPSIYSNAFFSSIGIVAVVHFILIFIFGYNLILITKQIMREITDLHHVEILSFLRSQVKKS